MKSKTIIDLLWLGVFAVAVYYAYQYFNRIPRLGYIPNFSDIFNVKAFTGSMSGFPTNGVNRPPGTDPIDVPLFGGIR